MKDLEPFCFWCGGNPCWDPPTEPRPFHLDPHRFCENCKAAKGPGIAVFELSETDPGCGNPIMPSGAAYYTGRWVVIDDRTAERVFPPQALAGVLNTRFAGLRWDNYASAGFNIYPWRPLQ